jgi:hypothetical protein
MPFLESAWAKRAVESVRQKSDHGEPDDTFIGTAKGTWLLAKSTVELRHSELETAKNDSQGACSWTL